MEQLLQWTLRQTNRQIKNEKSPRKQINEQTDKQKNRKI
jgi:hypothetical protein